MRFQSFLLTEGRTKRINIDEFVKNVKKKCYQMLDTYKNNGWKYMYYRGINDEFNSSFGFIQPSKYTRESMWAGHNTYTLLIDNLPSWSAFPKRSKSVIMTTNKNNAQSRAGNNIPYIIFPVNNSKIGICSKSDIWDSFPKLTSRFQLIHLNGFNRMIGELIIWFGDEMYDQDDWNDLKKLFNTAIPDPESEEGYKAEQTIDRYDLEPFVGKKLSDAIFPYLDPKKNGFKLFTPRNKIPDSDLETWTDGDCYLLAYDHLKVIKEQL